MSLGRGVGIALAMAAGLMLVGSGAKAKSKPSGGGGTPSPKPKPKPKPKPSGGGGTADQGNTGDQGDTGDTGDQGEQPTDLLDWSQYAMDEDDPSVLNGRQAAVANALKSGNVAAINRLANQLGDSGYCNDAAALYAWLAAAVPSQQAQYLSEAARCYKDNDQPVPPGLGGVNAPPVAPPAPPAPTFDPAMTDDPTKASNLAATYGAPSLGGVYWFWTRADVTHWETGDTQRLAAWQSLAGVTDRPQFVNKYPPSVSRLIAIE